MATLLVQALFNGLLVTVGLYALWSLMKAMPPRQRGWSALVAGSVSAVASLAITLAIMSASSA